MEHSLKIALSKLKKYCSYQERCHKEVLVKAKSLGIYLEEEANLLLKELIQENFLNEERFVELYVKSKMNQKSWGSKKIKLSLQQKEISPYLITKYLSKDINAIVFSNLDKLSKKYFEQHKNLNAIAFKYKLIQHLIAKGYHYEDITKYLQDNKSPFI